MNRLLDHWTSLSPRARDALSLLVVVIAAIATRFYRLGADSLWLDEAHTYFRALLPVPELIEDSIRRFHNPSYFLLMHAVVTKGASEFVLRAPSAVASVLVAPLIFAIGRMASGRALGLISASLYLLSTSQLRYAQEARMYAMLTLCAAIAITAATWVLTHADVAADPAVRGGASSAQRRASFVWLAYAVSLSSALYLHNGGAFLCAGIASSFGIAAAVAPQRKGLLRMWALTTFGAALSWVPWLPNLGAQQERWATPFTYGLARFKHLQDVFVFGYRQPLRALLALGLIGVGVFRMRGRPSLVLFLLGVCISGPTILWLMSLHKEVFELRLLLWAGLASFPLLGAGLLAAPWWWVRWPLTLVFIVWCALDFRGYHQVAHRPDWRGAATFLAANVKPNDAVLVHGTQGRPLAYYWDTHDNPPHLLLARGNLQKKTRKNAYLWHAMRSGGRTRFDKEIAERLQGFTTLDAEHVFDGAVVVRRYKRLRD